MSDRDKLKFLHDRIHEALIAFNKEKPEGDVVGKKARWVFEYMKNKGIFKDDFDIFMGGFVLDFELSMHAAKEALAAEIHVIDLGALGNKKKGYES